MSEIPEIRELRRFALLPVQFRRDMRVVDLDDAERELRSALDRQTREIAAIIDDPQVREIILRDFAPKEADPR